VQSGDVLLGKERDRPAGARSRTVRLDQVRGPARPRPIEQPGQQRSWTAVQRSVDDIAVAALVPGAAQAVYYVFWLAGPLVAAFGP
jgi:hypothetical protein